MYDHFFGFEKTPFTLTPDPSFLYLSRAHRVAFDALLYAIRERKGFSLLSGEIGTGKTLTCRAIMNELDPEVYHTALLFNPFLSTTELLQAISKELGLDASHQSGNKLLEQLYDSLLARAQMGGTTIIFLDEAQNFSIEALEAVRMISNLETANEKLVQIILMGQPEVEKKLASYELRQLNQRIHVRARLSPLSETDVAEYVNARIKAAGGDRVSFEFSAMRRIYRRTRGFPRLINILCDRALLAAYVNEVHTIDSKLVERAYVDLQGVTAPEKSSRFRSWLKLGWS